MEGAWGVAGESCGLGIIGTWAESASLVAGCWHGTNYFRFVICEAGFVVLTAFPWRLSEIMYSTE